MAMTQLSNKRVIICSIVRNAEDGLRKNIPVIDKLCSYFKDYDIVVYENDSKDKTKEILKNWQKQVNGQGEYDNILRTENILLPQV